MAPVLGEGVLCEWSGPVRTTHDDVQEDKDGASIGRGCVVRVVAGQYIPPMMIFRRIRMAPVLGEDVLCERSRASTYHP